MNYNIAEYVIGWRFNSQHHDETMADLSQTIFVRSNKEPFKRTKTHTSTHTYGRINPGMQYAEYNAFHFI